MEANVKYLTLALDVRKITDALIDFVEEGKELGDDEDFLRSFLNTLEERGGVGESSTGNGAVRKLRKPQDDSGRIRSREETGLVEQAKSGARPIERRPPEVRTGGNRLVRFSRKDSPV